MNDEFVNSETTFALCNHCTKCTRGCDYINPPRLVCPFFDLEKAIDVAEVCNELTGEFMQAHGKEAHMIRQQMVRLSHMSGAAV
jgi:hypothetical protein